MKHEFHVGERVVFNADAKHRFPLHDTLCTLIEPFEEDSWVAQLDIEPVEDEVLYLSAYNEKTLTFLVHEDYLTKAENKYSDGFNNIDALL